MKNLLNKIKIKKEFDGLQKHEALAHYKAEFVSEIGGFGVYDVTNTLSNHKYRVRVKAPVRMGFQSSMLNDTPRGKCPCVRAIKPCQHLFIATWKNESRCNRTLSESFFSTFVPSKVMEQGLLKVA